MSYYAPQYGGGYTTPQPQPRPPAKRPWWPWAVLSLAVVFLASGVWYAYEYRIKKDSGIAACEAFRDKSKVDGASTDTNSTLTEAQYRQLRKVFEDSRYDDIKAAGTKMMDVLWQVSQLGKNPGIEALPYLGQMMSAITDVQGACANHGIVIKFDLSGAVAGPSAAARLKCGDLFRSGKTIDQGKATAGCSDSYGELGAIGDLACHDGRHLFTANNVAGVPNGWGWGGDTYHAVDDAGEDLAFTKALQRCTS